MKRILVVVLAIYLLTMLAWVRKVGGPTVAVLATAARVDVFPLQS